MSSSPASSPASPESSSASSSAPFGKTQYKVLSAISLSHFLNDATQSLLLPLYPMLRGTFSLTYTQIGMITLTYQLTASLLQPLVGIYTDKHPQPYSLPIGMTFSLAGLIMIAFAPTYTWILAGAALLGVGSSVFHPESSRMARLAAGGQFGLAQSVFQVGGNAGSSCGPLLATIIVPLGQWSISLFAVLPLSCIFLLLRISAWAKKQYRAEAKKPVAAPAKPLVTKPVLVGTLVLLLILMFSKAFYMAGISSYFIFYLEHKFALSTQASQLYLFLFLFASALGTLIGGPLGDRIGRKYVIWFSILGAAPFSLALPYAGLFWTAVLAVLVGFIMSSAFSAMVVMAQELMPGHVGAIAGLFFGLSFGMAGLGAAVLGSVADSHGIAYVYQICAYLPLLGILAVFLPTLKTRSG